MEANTPLPCWCAYQRFKKSWLPQRRLEDLWPPSVEPASKLSCLGFTFSRHSCLQHRLQPLMQKFSVNPDVYFVTSLKISYFEAAPSPSHQRVLLDEFVFCAVTSFFQQNLVCPKFEEAPFSPFTTKCQYPYPPYPFLYIFFGTDKENLFNNHSFLDQRSFPSFYDPNLWFSSSSVRRH